MIQSRDHAPSLLPTVSLNGCLPQHGFSFGRPAQLYRSTARLSAEEDDETPPPSACGSMWFQMQCTLNSKTIFLPRLPEEVFRQPRREHMDLIFAGKQYIFSLTSLLDPYSQREEQYGDERHEYAGKKDDCVDKRMAERESLRTVPRCEHIQPAKHAHKKQQ